MNDNKAGCSLLILVFFAALFGRCGWEGGGRVAEWAGYGPAIERHR